MGGTQGLGRRLGTLAAVLALWMLAAELAARAFWAVAYDVPFLEPDHVLRGWYKLRRVERAAPSRDDGVFDVLLLGGSVLSARWGTVPQELRRQLAEAGVGEKRVFDLAEAAHTTRDSLLKYRALGDLRFDLVVLYHGINETRANNAPPGIFRRDYSHYEWYEMLNALAPYHGAGGLALPYTARFVALRWHQLFRSASYVPLHRPHEAWLAYGSELRSAEAFDANLSEILELARERGDPVLLMTFALHVPDDYSEAAFEAGQLDYGRHVTPLERWGLPENVVAGVAAHNAVLRRLAAGQGALFVDQEARLPRGARWFDDACHLTPEGSARFVELMLEPVLSDGGPAAR